MFERNGIYYALFSWCCCFCKQGSGIIVHTAPHPLGPWTVQAVGPSYERGDVACVAKAAGSGDEDAPAAGPGLGTDPTPGLGCEYKNASETSSTRAQQNSSWVSGQGQGGEGGGRARARLLLTVRLCRPAARRHGGRDSRVPLGRRPLAAELGRHQGA